MDTRGGLHGTAVAVLRKVTATPCACTACSASSCHACNDVKIAGQHTCHVLVQGEVPHSSWGAVGTAQDTGGKHQAGVGTHPAGVYWWGEGDKQLLKLEDRASQTSLVAEAATWSTAVVVIRHKPLV